MPKISDGIDRRGETDQGDRQDEECREWVESNGYGEQRDGGGERGYDGFRRHEAKEPQNDTSTGGYDGGDTGRETLRLWPFPQADGK